MEIQERENELFERWKKKRNYYKSFDEDGVVNPEIWEFTNPKILFILKETDNLNGDLRSFLRNGGSSTYHRTWNNIVRWAEVILYDSYSDKLYNERRIEILSKICAINLKKESGGKRTNKGEVRLAAKDDNEFIQEQISLYQPDIVIACGFGLTADTLRNIVYMDMDADWKNDVNELWYYKSDKINSKKAIHVISMPHPNRAAKDKWSKQLQELYRVLNQVDKG